ncbi:AMP-dependent synthetase/ligase in alkane synthesis cluster [Olavius algarvensis Delta 1 endosymbiont]|nr:AMP-dependent synthetase/ligase in alkane synthesis cluster [Olavius algarvensis Delta 1 endosymbiont]
MNMINSDAQPAEIVNVATHLTRMAREQPYKRAVVYPAGRDKRKRVTYAHMTFLQFEYEVDCLAHGLIEAGISRGTRTVLMVKPSIEFFALIFAVFKTGAVPVVVDPGMGIRRMLSCYKSTRPEAFIGIPLAHVVRTLAPKFFKTVSTWITVGRRWFWGGLTLDQVRRPERKPFQTAATARDETAAILFTTGSTGPAKGAIYTHGNFDAQLEQIKTHLNMSADEIDLSTFPLFALFYPALGVTAVIPDMDPTRPALVNPDRIIEAVNNQGITNMFASPALLNRVGSYGKINAVKLPSLKRVISAGAPVSPANIEQFSMLLSEDAEIHTPYGATEAVPIISIRSDEILAETRSLSEKGYGICIGRPINDIDIKLIKISDEPIESWSDDLAVAAGEIGEITVKGPLVSHAYYEDPRATALAKIQENGGIRHRMGDLGWLDDQGRIWFCGRKSHRVTTAAGTLYTIPCEAIFNTHPAVFRSALVGIGPREQQKPVICIELPQSGNSIKKNVLKDELLGLAAGNKLTQSIRTLLFHKAFPVDIRHNSKIFREKLAVWAERKIK